MRLAGLILGGCILMAVAGGDFAAGQSLVVHPLPLGACLVVLAALIAGNALLVALVVW